ncbi:MAG: glycine--tRNA ligase [Candidatus Woesearchaeota archaeon]
MDSIEKITTFCKQKGFIFQSSEIYGGLSGFWDYGPLGVELFNNLKQHWWKTFIHSQENMVGLDASIISHPRVWKASGHLDSFGDLLLTCSKCRKKYRADHLIEEKLDLNVEGMEIEKINQIIKENNLACPECKSDFAELKDFNLLFKTNVGAEEGKASEAYLRGETAQGMFTDFKLIAESQRLKLPFGIGQIGKCFRNEISPRDFIFRCREFSIAEFEFFLHPNDEKCSLLTEKDLNLEFNFMDAETQEKNENVLNKSTIKELLSRNKLGEWHAYWLSRQIRWTIDIGLSKENIKVREHTKDELSHYSSATFDMDYSFPFGSKEIAGNANRGQYDLTQHMKESGQKMQLFDEESKEKVIPRVIEPTFGMDRVFLATLVDAFTDDKRGNIVLKLEPSLAPIKCAILPLMNKENLTEMAREVFTELNQHFNCTYDKSGSIGRRYARQDEIGTPFCITIDYDSLENGDVTIRDRDTTEQTRVKKEELAGVILKRLKKNI